MGFILSKFRKKKSTLDVLEKIESDLSLIREYKQNTEAWERKILRSTITYSVVFYLMMMFIVYFKYFPEAKNVNEKLWLLLPFFLAPLIIYMLRRFLTWWYHRKIRKNDTKLKKLQETKAKILEEVMEKETYKVAKQILEKFAPAQLNRPAGSAGVRSSTSSLNASLPVTTRNPPPRPGQPDLRQRRPGPGGPGPAGPGLNQTLASSQPSSLNQTLAVVPSASKPGAQGPGGLPEDSLPRPPMVLGGRGAQGPPLPRPVLPRERGYLDKFVEYLVGDGPSNRYALICKQCQSHNGMALREEFEYIAYRCCYCYYWNPARKQRPVAPRLPDPGQVRTEDTDSSRSSSASVSRSSSRSGSRIALEEGGGRIALEEGSRIALEEGGRIALEEGGRIALEEGGRIAAVEGGSQTSRRNSQSDVEGASEVKATEETKHNEEIITGVNSRDTMEDMKNGEDNLGLKEELGESTDEGVGDNGEMVKDVPGVEDEGGNESQDEDLENKVQQINEVVKSDGDFELVNAQEQVTTDSDEAMDVDGAI